MVMSWKSGSKLPFGRRKSIDNRPLDVPIPTLDVDQILPVTASQVTQILPVTASQVTEILTQISTASRRGERTRCRKLVAKIRTLGKDSQSNRSCIASNGAGRVLAAAFNAFSGETAILEEILSVLSTMVPLDDEARWHIGSPESLKSIASIADSGSPSNRLNAVLLIKELAPSVSGIAATEGLVEALVKLIREPISPKATKASLVAIFYLVSSDKKVAVRLTEMGLVSDLLDMLVDAEKSTCEKAIGVLDRMFSVEKGREEAYEHALAVPVLVKKMFRVSEVATEFAISAIWKLCKGGGGRGCVVEALQVGAFQKLLLLLQVGCSEAAKGKASDLLKLLNASRAEIECVESMDFRGLKRSF